MSRGILFSGPLVLALLANRKTVTRRLDKRWLKLKVGELLYVRETIRRDAEPFGEERWCTSVFAADGAPTRADCWPWQRDFLPSIHMPHGLARIHLRVTEPPRVERVQDITEAEVLREGVPPHTPPCERDSREHTAEPCDLLVERFEELWSSLHDKPGERWTDNPEVVRIGFERVGVVE